VAPRGGRRGPRHRGAGGGGSRVSSRCLGFGGAATARGRRRHVGAEPNWLRKGREQETGRRFVRNRNGEDLVSAMLSFFRLSIFPIL
jgi:hypothetical protein